MNLKKAMDIEDKIKLCRDIQKEIKTKDTEIESLAYRISHPEEDDKIEEMIFITLKDGREKTVVVTDKSEKEIRKLIYKVA